MNLCGICSVESELLLSLDKIYFEKHNLKRIIHELTQEEYTEEEYSEAWICDVCADKLVDFHAFREKLFDLHKNLERIKASENVIEVENGDKQADIHELHGGNQANADDNDIEFVHEDDFLLPETINEAKGKDVGDVELDKVDRIDPLFGSSLPTRNTIIDNKSLLKCVIVKQQDDVSPGTTRVSKSPTHNNSGCSMSGEQYSSGRPSRRPGQRCIQTDFSPQAVEGYRKNISGRIPCGQTRTCPLCFSQYHGARGLRKHLLGIHAIDFFANGVQYERIICDKCKVPYSNMNSFELHRCVANSMCGLRQKRIQLDNLNCPNCSFVFKCADSFRSHVKHAYNLSDDIVDLFLRPWRVLNKALESKEEKQIAGSTNGLSAAKYENPKESLIDPLECNDESKSGLVKCSKCPRILDNRLKLYDHRLFYHMKIIISEEEEEEYGHCPMCAQMVNLKGSWEKLKHHINTRHKEIEYEMQEVRAQTGKILCPECDEPFDDVVAMYDHFKAHDTLLNHGDNVDGYNFECESCSLTLNDLDEYAEHQRAKHKITSSQDIFPIKCVWCGQRLKQLSLFHRHLQSYHDRVPIKKTVIPDSVLCTFCGKILANRHSLQAHLDTHTEDARVKCKLCSAVLKHKLALRRHMIGMHKDIGRRTCNVCGKEFKTTSITKHLKTHGIGEVKMHECRICQKQFNNLGNMKAHMWIHRDEFPHNCKFCKKGFMRKKKMNEHIESEHPSEENDLA